MQIRRRQLSGVSLPLSLWAFLALGLSVPAGASDFLILDRPKGRVQYAEMYSVRPTTEGALVWLVEDARHPDLLGHLSTLSLLEIDCGKKKVRTRLEKRYTGSRAQGRSTHMGTVNSDWRDGTKGASPDRILVERLCPA